MEKYNCLVCNKEMEIHNKIAFVDYICNRSDDHHFSWRIKNQSLIKLRIRFQDDKHRLCLKVHYDEQYSQVWSKAKTPDIDRIRINQIIVPNFEDIEKLKNKIRTLLVFG
jgi:hypothetical protein